MKNFTTSMPALWVCGVLMMLIGCGRNEFKIDFEFPKDHIGNYLITYYAWNSHEGRWMEQTASIQEGTASVGCVTHLPTLVYINDASSSNTMTIYAERGDKIKISGEGMDMKEWTVKGNGISERWSVWRKDAYSKKNDKKAFETSIKEYVEKNSSDPLSAILLLTEWDRRANPEGFVKLWNSIDKSVKTQQLIEMCGAPDLLGLVFSTQADGKLSYSKDSRLKSIILRTFDNGIDTLKFNKAKGSLLYFFSDSNSSGSEIADSLRKLTKQYPDSAKRIICDIYVDSDSMKWASAINRDSLKGVVRAWNPYGIAEERMAKLGVVRLPWYIVKDKTGMETYAGDDIKMAVSSFRREMDKKEKK
ncbi:MAG: hypothetical protein K2G85_07935 [Muribaculaceae bacterium]|nr:hypothetical protein [Muribaculaceae bacterium]